MKNIHKLLSCSCALFLSLQSPALSDFAHTPGKSSVIVLQGEVTIDGQSRADLGRSFADTITGGLLKTRAYTVIDHLGTQPIAQAIEKNPNIAPEQSAIAIGKNTGARWIYVPRMVVEGDFNKLTLKKIRVSDGQVVDVFETHATGGRETMFVLIGSALKDIYRDTARNPARLGKTPTGEPLTMPIHEPAELDPNPLPNPANNTYQTPAEEITPEPEPVEEPEVEDKPAKETKVVSIDKQQVPAGLKLENGTHIRDEPKKLKPVPAPDPPEIKDPGTETENQFARYMGSIRTVNPEWRFCILKLNSSKKLKIGDRLSVKTDKIVPTETTLEVTKIEGTQIVADLVEDADLDTLKVGQKFYKWTPR